MDEVSGGVGLAAQVQERKKEIDSRVEGLDVLEQLGGRNFKNEARQGGGWW